MKRLTKRQQECLQLAGQGYTSKEIARQLGISPSTVDNHLYAASQTMEVGKRAEAARRFKSESEGSAGGAEPPKISPASGPSATDLVEPLLPVGSTAPSPRDIEKNLEEGGGQNLPRQTPSLVRPPLPQNDVEAITTSRGGKQPWRPLPPIGGRENRLGIVQRLLFIGQIAFVSVLFFVACVIVVRTCLSAMR